MGKGFRSIIIPIFELLSVGHLARIIGSDSVFGFPRSRSSRRMSCYVWASKRKSLLFFPRQLWCYHPVQIMSYHCREKTPTPVMSLHATGYNACSHTLPAVVMHHLPPRLAMAWHDVSLYRKHSRPTDPGMTWHRDRGPSSFF